MTNTDAPKNKGGRPKKLGPLLTPAERQARRAAKVARSGGRIMKVALSAEEASALDQIRARDGHTTDLAAIGAALLREAKRKGKPAA